MPNLNKVFLMGNLTREPESRFLPSGMAVCNFGMAINRTFYNRDNQKQEEVCFVDIDVWGKQAESCQQYLRRGAPVMIEGRLRFDSWDDRDSGKKRSKLSVTAERVQFIGAPGGGGDFDDGGEAGGNEYSGGGGGSRGGSSRGADSGAGRGGSSRGNSDEGGGGYSRGGSEGGGRPAAAPRDGGSRDMGGSRGGAPARGGAQPPPRGARRDNAPPPFPDDDGPGQSGGKDGPFSVDDDSVDDIPF